MTALAGLWDFSGGGTADRCARMLKAQQIYGPHHSAQANDGPLSLGRNLFRLLPEDVHDRGPVRSEDGRRILVADVRIDNRDELADQLGCGTALSDAAVLMRALERWGEAALDHVIGDFAFAYWDGDRLLLARDFLGQRPLHYHSGDGFFAFASMAKGIHALPEVPHEASDLAVADFLALMPETGTGTFFAGIERVLPGHVVTVSRSGITSRRYWNPSRTPLKLASSEDYEDALRAQFDTAVRSRLRGSGGTVASHLSAGLDSSTVAATAARLGSRVIAFTAVPEGDWAVPYGGIADEGPLAAATAALHPNIEHVCLAPGRASPFDSLDRDFFLYERPFLNLCNGVWSRAINDEAKRRGLTVLLTGQMGNMTFSHAGMQILPGLLRTGRLLKLAGAARAMKRHGVRWRTIAAATLGPFLPSALWSRLRPRGLAEVTALKAGAIEDFGIHARAEQRGFDTSYRPWGDSFDMRLWVMSRVDLGVYNKGALAGWGIDTRDPTADRRLVEFCLSVPEEQYCLDGLPRSLARRAFADRLPSAVLEERRKGYQGADWHVGLSSARQELAGELERIAECGPAAAMIDLDALEQRLADWPAGGWDKEAVIRHYRLALLRGVSAGHFLRKATGAN